MNSNPLSSLGDLTWTDTHDLVILEFKLLAEKDYYLFPDYSKGLHAWFLDQVRQLCPDLSQRLHDYPEEKGFTISRLQGNYLELENKVFLKQDSVYSWYLSIFSPELMKWLKIWFDKFPSHLGLHHAPLLIQEVRFSSAPSTYENLWQSKLITNFSLTFLSCTSFRRHNHHYPLPHPPNLFQSYLRRWNQFSQKVFSQDSFIDWVDKFVIIRQYNLQSTKVAGGKKGSVTGFIGSIELYLGHNYQDFGDYSQLFSTLCRFALYCGTGHKTTFGLGYTRLGWAEIDNNTVEQTENSLSGRIDELLAIFLAKKGTKGGNRAKNICISYAEIVAKKELGQSLQDIALELEMPYETVKTYSKRAMKLLGAKT
ncbi:MAG: CRISPR-associated endoribonuclease Cas6 [Cyanobacterium sp. T60_A2020_053]|nr:CRISPR-associated endoribonuclease Cas6 [Cyanobacterium sp. T60_A2020_053]